MGAEKYLNDKKINLKHKIKQYDSKKHAWWNVTLQELMDDYAYQKIKVYRHLQLQYRRTGCETCLKAMENIEREWDKLIEKNG